MSTKLTDDGYEMLKEKLDEGCHLHQCNNCGHYAGDPRPGNFYARCPDCEKLVRFYRIIE